MSPAEPLDMALDGQRYRLLINAVTDYAIFMIDPEGQITTWNLGAQRLKGYEEAEILGRNFAVSTPMKTAKAASRVKPWKWPSATESSRKRAGASARTAAASGLT
jgi:PAS domain-containing protein